MAMWTYAKSRELTDCVLQGNGGFKKLLFCGYVPQKLDVTMIRPHHQENTASRLLSSPVKPGWAPPVLPTEMGREAGVSNRFVNESTRRLEYGSNVDVNMGSIGGRTLGLPRGIKVIAANFQ
jgi:hypothetical protein